MQATKRGAVSAPVTKIVAARQAWRCAGCESLLPAAFQIDHREPLWRGGPDHLDNLQALCPNCHAAKTQREAIDRRAMATDAAAAAAYDDRTDTVVGPGRVRCEECREVRPSHRPHPICWALEHRSRVNPLVATSLLQFAWKPRVGPHNR